MTWIAPLALMIAAAEPTVAPVVLVAAASDLSEVFAEIGKAFEAEHGEASGKVSFTFAASGVIAKQLKEGAPFDLFAAANSSFVDDAVAAGACDGATKALYARGHLALWTKRGGRVSAPRHLSDLADARFAHVAIANPATAPYGAAAKEALTAAGLWSSVAPRIVLGENIRQTFALVDSGNADVAIVARSLAIGAAGGSFVDIDDSLYAPLDQALAVCTRGRNAAGAGAFARYVLSAKGQQILQRFGFTEPAATSVLR